MCVIAVCQTRKLTFEEAHQCANTNKDGIGFAWISGSKVQWKKGFMKLGDFWQEYEKLSVLPHVIHFRLATGKEHPLLTHPFAVSLTASPTLEGKAEAVLFHNGVVSNWEQIIRDLLPVYAVKQKKLPIGPWSDSRAVACAVAAAGPEILDFYNGKYVYFSPNVLLLYGDFVEENGIQFSNTTFKAYSYISKSKSERGDYKGLIEKERDYLKEYEEKLAKESAEEPLPMGLGHGD